MKENDVLDLIESLEQADEVRQSKIFDVRQVFQQRCADDKFTLTETEAEDILSKAEGSLPVIFQSAANLKDMLTKAKKKRILYQEEELVQLFEQEVVRELARQLEDKSRNMRRAR